MKTSGCAPIYRLKAVVPDRIAPMMRALGSVPVAVEITMQHPLHAAL
jgi:hypothetical protein